MHHAHSLFSDLSALENTEGKLAEIASMHFRCQLMSYLVWSSYIFQQALGATVHLGFELEPLKNISFKNAKVHLYVAHHSHLVLQ